MKEIRFTSPEQMLEVIYHEQDIYCPETETYIFMGNDYGSLTYYPGITMAMAYELEEQAVEDDGYWTDYLGYCGENIRSKADLESDGWPDDGALMDYINSMWQHKFMLCGHRFEE